MGESEQVRIGDENGVLWRPDGSKKRNSDQGEAAAAPAEEGDDEQQEDLSKTLFAVMNQLALGGTQEGELFVLSVAADEDRDWQVRNRALFSLSMFR